MYALTSRRIWIAPIVLAAVMSIAVPAVDAQVTQQWVATHNGTANGTDQARALAVDGSGNVYVTGNSAGSGGAVQDFATVKYDAAGVQQWVRTYNGPGDSSDVANALVVDGAGNVYVTGFSYGAGTADQDFLTIKYDTNGNEQWVARYNGPVSSWDEALALAVDGAGNVFVTGRSSHMGSWFDFDYLTIKYDAAGQEQWVARHNGGGNGWDQANAIALDADGGVYVTGHHEWDAGTAYHDYATIKYTGAGIEEWIATYDGAGQNSDHAVALAIDDAGFIYVTGYSAGSGTGWDYATAKYDASGNEVWSTRYDGPGDIVSHDVGAALTVDGAGNTYATGSSALDFGTVKYDASGVQQWEARFGTGGAADTADAIELDGSGNVYVTGGSANNYRTVKYNAAGAQQWSIAYNGPGNGVDAALDLEIDAGGNVYVTGYAAGSGGSGANYATIKYTQALTSVEQPAGGSPFGVALAGNFPNPFRGSTTIKFDIPAGSAGRLALRIYDASGRRVATLVEGHQGPGVHAVEWDASAHSSGEYFYRLEGDGFVRTQKMLLMR